MEKRKLSIGIFVALLVVLLYGALDQVWAGRIPFWLDPGRDFLLGLENLNKLRLIGVPTGIPGVFYLPYWIWLTSFFQIFSRDPRIVVTFLMTIPYFLLLPIFFFLLRNVFRRVVAIALSLLFFLGFLNYPTQFWNPNLAPLFFLILAFFICRSSKFNGLFIGILTGFNLAFNMGFGMAIAIAAACYVIFWRRKIWDVSLFFLGVGLVFVPFFVFEARHGFNQTRSLVEIVIGSKTIGLAGLSKAQIANLFLGMPGKVLSIPWVLGLVIFLAAGAFSFRKKFEKKEKNLLVFLILCLASLFALYFLAKNPKWDYHFVGVEMIFFLLIGIFVHRAKLDWFLLGWVMILFVVNVFVFRKEIKITNLDLVSKMNAVNLIYRDAGKKAFAVRVFNPAIYTFDYDYLFQWLGKEKYGRMPTSEDNADLIYYINYPEDDLEKPTKLWSLNGGTVIIKKTRSPER